MINLTLTWLSLIACFALTLLNLETFFDNGWAIATIFIAILLGSEYVLREQNQAFKEAVELNNEMADFLEGLLDKAASDNKEEKE